MLAANGYSFDTDEDGMPSFAYGLAGSVLTNKTAHLAALDLQPTENLI